MGGVTPAWHQALAGPAVCWGGRASHGAQYLGVFPRPELSPHCQFQLFSLLLSQKFTISPSSNPALSHPGCVTLGRSPCLSESQAPKRE